MLNVDVWANRFCATAIFAIFRYFAELLHLHGANNHPRIKLFVLFLDLRLLHSLVCLLGSLLCRLLTIHEFLFLGELAIKIRCSLSPLVACLCSLANGIGYC